MGLILNNYFFGRGDTSCNLAGACAAMNSNSFVTARGNSVDDEKSVPSSKFMEELRSIAKSKHYSKHSAPTQQPLAAYSGQCSTASRTSSSLNSSWSSDPSSSSALQYNANIKDDYQWRAQAVITTYSSPALTALKMLANSSMEHSRGTISKS